MADIDKVLASIGGQLTEAESRVLILKKLYDVASQELSRYLNTEKLVVIQTVEKLWDKYAVANRQLESRRSETLTTLNGFLAKLGYLSC